MHKSKRDDYNNMIISYASLHIGKLIYPNRIFSFERRRPCAPIE